ncbi:CENP-B homolog protein 2-like [Gossypium arboreum]|uniref:CENP-B homolog protein 2-like n=1 Tax=Gossypium arboreum TaxID=29729 RepID=UPI0008193C9A|nr:CENP-B homolog protein 2-like [Gossypium arboreum]
MRDSTAQSETKAPACTYAIQAREEAFTPDVIAVSKEIKNINVKRHKSTKYPKLEKVLYEWFLLYQEKVNMTGEMIQTKAKDWMRRLIPHALSEFNFSIGWLEQFKARRGIKSYRIFGESGSVDLENIEDTLPQIRAKLESFDWKDIYNMDETSLFYRLQADHSLATKQLEGRKKDKERFIVVVCYNGNGSDKVSLWVIGKFARCFKHVNIDNLNCHYRAKKKSMDDWIAFSRFCSLFDARMTGRNVLLIVDNCPAHPKVIESLRNVELFFCLQIQHKKIQPCDAGIIRVIKIYYQRRFYFSILEDYEKGEINPEKINVLDAIHFINATWNIDVKPTIIANCFRHCKIRFEEDMPLEQEIGDVEGIHKLKEVISYLHYRNAMDVEQTLNYPSETESLIESSMDEEIIQGVMDVSANDEQDLDDSSILPHVSPKKAFLAVDTLKNYLIQHEKNIPDLIYALLKVKDEIVFDSHAKKKQLTIYTYFSKE